MLRPPGEQEPPAAPYAVPLALLLVALVAAAWLFALASAPPLHPDTSRDLLLAEDCRRGLSCQASNSSLPGVRHMPGWILLLAALPLDTMRLHALSIASQGLALALMGFTLAPHLSRLALALTMVLALRWQADSSGYPLLWGPALSPLPVALSHLALALSLRREGSPRSAWFAPPLALLAALPLGLAAQGHLAYALGAVPLFFGLALAPRPALGLPLAAVGLAVALRPDQLPLLGVSEKAVALGGLALLIASGVGLRARRSLASLSPLGRERLVAAVHLGVAALALLAAHQITGRYLLTALLPLVLWMGLLLDTLLARWRVWVLTAVGLWMLGPPLLDRRWLLPPQRQFIDLPGLQTTAERLRQEGRSVQGLGMWLRGHRGWETLTTLAVFGLPISGPAQDRDLRLVAAHQRVDPLLVAAGWTRVVSRFRGGVWASDLLGWANLAQARACTQPAGAACSPAQGPLLPLDWRGHSERLTYLSVPAWQTGSPPVYSPPFFLRIPIEATSDEERSFLLLEPQQARFVGAEGVEVRGAVPGHCVTLRGPGRGTLLVEVGARGHGEIPLFSPDLLELRGDERALRDAIITSATQPWDAPVRCPP